MGYLGAAYHREAAETQEEPPSLEGGWTAEALLEPLHTRASL